MPEKAADDSAGLPSKVPWGHQVGEYRVVIAGVKRNLAAAAAFHHGSNYIERLVTIKGSDLNCDDVRDRHHLAPEFDGQRAASYRRLQVEADDGDHLRNGPRMCDQLTNAEARQPAEAQEHSVIAEILRSRCFVDCRSGRAAHTRDFRDVAVTHLFGSQFKHWTVEAHFGPADRKLRRVDGDRNAAGTCIEVVPSQRTLSPFV